MGMKNIIYGNFFVGEAEEKSPLGRTRCRWEGHNLKQLDVRMWTGFISLRTRTGDGIV